MLGKIQKYVLAKKKEISFINKDVFKNIYIIVINIFVFVYNYLLK